MIRDHLSRDELSPVQMAWSFGVGKWFAVPVRLHICLFLFIVLIFGIQANYLAVNQQAKLGAETALATSLILFVCILAHELAHVFATQNLGGAVRHIVLTPWGGDSDLEMPVTRRAQAIVYLAGPFINLMICLTGLMLLAQTDPGNLLAIINPLRPHGLGSEWAISITKITTWISFQLFWINLIPVHPFDASKLVRLAISSQHSDLEREKVETGVLIIGLAAATVMLVAAWLAKDVEIGPVKPVWCILCLAGISLLFSARHGYYLYSKPTSEEEWDDLVDELDQDYPDYFDDHSELAAAADAESISQWLQEKQESREQIEREIEAEEERRVDSILEKLHQSGIDSISDEEKGILQRVSDRYRRRNRELPS